jgi:DNA invertase Pin-like site-specific DNA recombinase
MAGQGNSGTYQTTMSKKAINSTGNVSNGSFPNQRQPVEAVPISRISDIHQLKGGGLERQEEGIERYVLQHNTFHGEPMVLANKKEFIIDADMSAFYGDNLDPTLSQFGLVLVKVREHKFPYRVLLAEATDRISRQGIPAFEAIIKELTDHGIEIHFTMEGWICHKDNQKDLVTHMRKGIFAAAAEKYSEDLRQRVHHGWDKAKERARKTGEPVTYTCPRWIEVVTDQATGKRSFRIIESRGRTVLQIFQWSAEGYGSLEIVHLLVKHGHEPFYPPKPLRDRPEGKPRKRPVRAVFEWTSSYVRQILNNRAVLGEYQPKNCINRQRSKKGIDPMENYYPIIEGMTQTIWDDSHRSMQRRNYNPAGNRGSGPRSKTVNGLCPPELILDVTRVNERRMYVEPDACKRPYLTSNPFLQEPPNRVRADFFEEAFKFYWKHLDWKSISKHTPSKDMLAKRAKVETISKAQDKLARRLRVQEEARLEIEDKEELTTLNRGITTDEASLKQLTKEKERLLFEIDCDEEKLRDFTTMAQLKDLSKQRTEKGIEARKRIRGEINKRVSRIELTFLQDPDLGKTAKVKIKFVTGVERKMILFCDAFYALCFDANDQEPVMRVDFEPFDPKFSWSTGFRLTKRDARNIHRLNKTGLTNKEIAAKLKIGRDSVWKQLTGKKLGWRCIYAEANGHFPGNDRPLPEVEIERGGKLSEATTLLLTN